MKTARGKVEVLADPQAIAEAGAERFVAAAQRTLADRKRFSVALSGGSTPKAMNQLLASKYRDRVEWSRVDVFFGDERCVPPEHKDSNYKMARESLLDHVPLGADRVHRIAGEKNPAEAAAAYQEIVTRVLGAGPIPRIDLVLLGMGPDGHTASLFPGTTALNEKKDLVTATFVEKLNAWRVTMTAPMLSAAVEVLVMAGGAEKADNLKVALEGPDGSVPIQLVKPSSGQMTWLVDRAAATKLSL
jgi:6-phosphogluconolactonase